MAFFIRVLNGQVNQVWDTPPPYGEDGWREAIEVRPAIDDTTQYYGTHSFDLAKHPAEIVWAVIDMTPEEVAATAAAKMEQAVREYTDVIQKRLDDFAKTRNYDGIMSACTYASSGNAQFALEGQYCVDVRDATWSACYTVMGEVQANIRVKPTVAELVALMPALIWPS